MRRIEIARALLIVVATSLLAAPPARAATWSAPIRIAGPTVGSASIQGSFSPSGRLDAFWSGTYHPDGCEYHCSPPVRTYAAHRAADGLWSTPVEIKGKATFAGSAIGPDGDDGSLLLGALGATEYEEPVAVGAVGLHGPAFDAPVNVSAGTTEPYEIGELGAAVGTSGDAILVWGEATALAPNYPIYAARRLPGRRFGRPKLLGRPRALYLIDTAVSDRGDAVTAWQAGDRWQARAATRGGSFGRTVTFRGRSLSHAATIDASGRATALLELRDRDRSRLVAYRWRGAGAVRRYTLDSWRVRGNVANLRVVSRGGETLAVWRDGPGDNAQIRTATFRAGGAAIKPVAGAVGTVPQSIDMLADGRAAVLLADGRVVLRDATGSLQVAEQPINAAQAQTGTVALDPRSGVPTVLFVVNGARDEGYSVFATHRIP
jgi:hypothetical protein